MPPPSDFPDRNLQNQPTNKVRGGFDSDELVRLPVHLAENRRAGQSQNARVLPGPQQLPERSWEESMPDEASDFDDASTQFERDTIQAAGKLQRGGRNKTPIHYHLNATTASTSTRVVNSSW